MPSHALTMTLCMYIGKAGRCLTDRFSEQLRSVGGYHQQPRYRNGGCPVAEHFNLPDPNYISNMKCLFSGKWKAPLYKGWRRRDKMGMFSSARPWHHTEWTLTFIFECFAWCPLFPSLRPEYLQTLGAGAFVHVCWFSIVPTQHLRASTCHWKPPKSA